MKGKLMEGPRMFGVSGFSQSNSTSWKNDDNFYKNNFVRTMRHEKPKSS